MVRNFDNSRKFSSKKMLFMITCIFIALFFASSVAGANNGINNIFKSTEIWIIITIIFLLVIIFVFVFYMFWLQRRLFKKSDSFGAFEQFMKTPAGLPVGTIRAIITLIIVLFSLYMVIISAFLKDKGVVFPDILSAVLSVVIGFYFGTRTARQRDSEVIAQIDSAGKQIAEKVTHEKEIKAKSLIKKIGKNIRLVKTVMNILPEKVRKKYIPFLEKLEKGIKLAEDLQKTGLFDKAVQTSETAHDNFKKDNPIKDLVKRAKASFDRVVKNIPGLSIISAVVAVDVALIGIVYHKWKMRILNRPFSPSILPLKLVDATTGFTLVMESPILKEAFKEQIESYNRGFMDEVAHDFLQFETANIWDRYKNHFESRESFEEGVQQFRMTAAKLELRSEIDPGLIIEVGDYETLMNAMDDIRKDRDAVRDLESLLKVIDELKKTGEPVKSIFEKVMNEMEEE